MTDNLNQQIEIGVLTRERNIHFCGPIPNSKLKEPKFINEHEHKRFVDNLLKVNEGTL